MREEEKALYQSALECLRREQWKEAEKLLRQFLDRLGSPHPRALYNLAVLAWRKGDYERARELLSRCVEVCPHYEQAKRALRQLLDGLALREVEREMAVQVPSLAPALPPSEPLQLDEFVIAEHEEGIWHLGRVRRLGKRKVFVRLATNQSKWLPFDKVERPHIREGLRVLVPESKGWRAGEVQRIEGELVLVAVGPEEERSEKWVPADELRYDDVGDGDLVLVPVKGGTLRAQVKGRRGDWLSVIGEDGRTYRVHIREVLVLLEARSS